MLWPWPRHIYRLSGRVLDSRPRCLGFEPHRRHCVVSLSKNINPSLVLVQPRKTRPFITERLLMVRKESNQAKKHLSLFALVQPQEDPSRNNWNIVDWGVKNQIIQKMSLCVSYKIHTYNLYNILVKRMTPLHNSVLLYSSESKTKQKHAAVDFSGRHFSDFLSSRRDRILKKTHTHTQKP